MVVEKLIAKTSSWYLLCCDVDAVVIVVIVVFKLRRTYVLGESI